MICQFLGLYPNFHFFGLDFAIITLLDVQKHNKKDENLNLFKNKECVGVSNVVAAKLAPGLLLLINCGGGTG